ncbi:MAG: flagellin [Gammaproteobacteria bacterium]|nr:flagellin [Gammaproteobacteria bacterium]
MAQIINTNVSSLTAQRNLNKSQSSLATAMQRLSSGLRINSAKDDAAGLAIAERMSTQIRGFNQAMRNANDGISLAQTAEGALGETTNNLQRIRELAVQAANSTNSDSDRAALQAEVAQRLAEITRVSSQTQFNGTNLLDGSFTNKSFQVGANANQVISIGSLVDARASSLGNNVLQKNGSITNTVVTGSGSANGMNAVAAAAAFTVSTTDSSGSVLTTSPLTYAADSGANIVAGVIDRAGSGIGVAATASNSATISGLSAAGTVTFTLNTQTDDGDGTFTAVTSAITAVISDKNDLSGLVSAINGVQSSTGITADFTTAGVKGSITLTTSDGRNIGISAFAVDTAGNDSVTFSGSVLTEGGTVAAVKTGTIELTSSRGTITLANADTEAFAAAGSSSDFSSLAAVDISSAAGAQSALAVLDAALGTVNSARADLGAYQNRFESTIANLSVSAENLSAARSRIRDADFAAETAELTRSQILQQAGVAMVSQANSLPQSVLSLLQ